MGSKQIWLYATWALFVAAIPASLWYGSYIDQQHPVVCAESTTVVTILELHYRDAVILTADGKRVTVNQATLKPGDSFCTKWIRKE